MCTMKGAGYCSFRRAILISYFEKVFMMNSIRTYRNLLKNFIFAHLLLLEDYDQGALRKDSVIATFIEQFKTATLRKSY